MLQNDAPASKKGSKSQNKMKTKSKKKMKVRDYVVPGNFEEAMGRGIPGFNNLEKAQRTKVAFYMWMAGTNRRKHRTEDGMSISYMDLEKSFKYYLTHKKEIREKIANDIGMTIDDAKMCLLALMFGAKMSTWEDNSIPQAIGKVRAGALFKHPRFKAIAGELSRGKKLILERSTKSKTKLINVMGKSISLKESTNKRLSHIIQGIEAQALKACLTLYPDDIVLLMHDGFVSKKALDVPLIEQTIYKATGMQLQLSGGVITLPSELDFSDL